VLQIYLDQETIATKQILRGVISQSKISLLDKEQIINV